MSEKTDIDDNQETEPRHFSENDDEAGPDTLADKPATTYPAASPDEPRLRALIEQIVDRDQSAFTELYGLMLGKVYGLALRITRNVQLAEEVAEDTFWQIWRQAPRFDAARGKAAVWIMTMARSRALDTFRQTHQSDLIQDDGEEAADCPDLSGNNPPDLLAAIEEGHIVHAALESLDPVPRQLLALAFFCGLSHDEIAGHAGLPLGTVKSHIRRALFTLRQRLGPDFDFNQVNL